MSTSPSSTPLSRDLLAVFLQGSLVRGDFRLGRSDIDFFVLFKGELQPEELLASFRHLQESLMAEFSDITGTPTGPRWVDVQGLSIPDLDHARNATGAADGNTFPPVYVGIYAFDLVANHIPVWWKPGIQQPSLANLIKAKDPGLFAANRIRELTTLIVDIEQIDPHQTPIRRLHLWGELVRATCIGLGLRSLSKDELQPFVRAHSQLLPRMAILWADNYCSPKSVREQLQALEVAAEGRPWRVATEDLVRDLTAVLAARGSTT